MKAFDHFSGDDCSKNLFSTSAFILAPRRHASGATRHSCRAFLALLSTLEAAFSSADLFLLLCSSEIFSSFSFSDDASFCLVGGGV